MRTLCRAMHDSAGQGCAAQEPWRTALLWPPNGSAVGFESAQSAHEGGFYHLLQYISTNMPATCATKQSSSAAFNLKPLHMQVVRSQFISFPISPLM